MHSPGRGRGGEALGRGWGGGFRQGGSGARRGKAEGLPGAWVRYESQGED